MTCLERCGLVLEGGGLRGVYTSGALEHLMEKEVRFPYVIGVSMGACNAANYISWQPGRNRIVNIKYVNDPRHLSYLRLFLHGELFGMKFIFDTIPNQLEPFDYDTFYNNPARYIITVTDCDTGQPVYFEKNELGADVLTILQASCSLPLVSQPVHYNGNVFLDGGISDSIPIVKSMTDGNQKHVLILTQPSGYRKKPASGVRLIKLKYPQFPALVESMLTRHTRYNAALDQVERLEQTGQAFVIRPDHRLKIKRAERNKGKLNAVYDQGYRDSEAIYPKLMDFLAGK